MIEGEQLRERLGRFLELLEPVDRAALTVVGGTAPALYDLAPMVAVRPTTDIDVVIEAATHLEWRRFVDKLEARRFRHHAGEGEPLCRFRRGDLVVDVMPTDERAIGFGSRWYADAVAHRIPAAGGIDVHVISPVFFLATKLEAWPAKERSGGDPMISHDVEDVVAVLRGVAGLLEEIRTGTEAVHGEVRVALRSLFDGDPGRELLAAHLEGDTATQATVPVLLRRIQDAVAPGMGPRR